MHRAYTERLTCCVPVQIHCAARLGRFTRCSSAACTCPRLPPHSCGGAFTRVRAYAGKALMDRGALKAALRYFEAALDMVALRTEAGGEAALQRAITLDSLQRHEEARDLYAQLRRHRTAQIAKKARQLDFGFDAGAARTAPSLCCHCAALHASTQRGMPHQHIGAAHIVCTFSLSQEPCMRPCAKLQPARCESSATPRAGKFLKADTMSYAATREEYDPFFTALSGIGKWTDPYVESEEEKARQARDNMLLFAGALALMATPIGFIGVLAIR